jgi:hypothetical protein
MATKAAEVAPTAAPTASVPKKGLVAPAAPVAPGSQASRAEQERTPALDEARRGLLTVLRVGALGSGARLLLQLRERSGVNAIYSASERRFVPLGYRG